MALALLAGALPAAAAESLLPYLDGPRAMIQRGVQAVLLCNGVFTSERPLEAVFREELAYLKAPLGSPATVGEPSDVKAEVAVDRDSRSVRIGALGQQSVSARYQP
ncbi:MAG: hypothetical protein ACPGC1_12625, partial [Pseudomonadales bacterium]